MLSGLTLVFSQGSNLPSSSKSSPPSSSSTKSPSNPYSVLQKFMAPPSQPATSDKKPPSTNEPKPKAPQKSNSNLSNIESIAPYNTGRDIFLDSNNSSSDQLNRRTRNHVLIEKEQKSNSKNESSESLRFRSLIFDYDPDQQLYETDLAKLIVIEKITSPSAKIINPVTKKQNSHEGIITALRDPIFSDGNLSASTSDPLIAKWERELAALMKNDEVENKSDKIAAISLRIDRRKQFIIRQAEALKGADIFRIDAAAQLSQRYLEDGWCNLFDGKTLFGWRVQDGGFYGGGRFTVENGEICSDPYYPGLLYTTNQFGDSTIVFEFCADKEAEVFFLYRTSPNPRDLNSSCYAVVLKSSDSKRPRGTILGRVKLDSEQIESMNKNNPENVNESENETKEMWQRVRFSCDSGVISCSIDNQLPTTLIDAAPLGRGYIGLLVTRGKARFRNIIWRPASSISLFDGIDVDVAWRYKRSEKFTVAAANTAIQFRGGPGVVESIELFSDFVLQFEYKINNVYGKAGLFFRANPREEKTGYELSLQNFPTRNDRDNFFAIDAGSFIGKKSGRFVGAEDMQWNYFTLVAVDRQFQTWVNGVAVCEMTDKSKLPKTVVVVSARDSIDGKEIVDYAPPEKNEFHKTGTIQFHLPTENSNFDVRNIKITKIAKRLYQKQTFEDHKKTTWKAKLKEHERIKNENKLDEELRKK
ncbi:MAG: DUF1080 domain-containing protein [Planctomycetaceae bacterium]|nr:DUF1080 domain-containing protein [Planctomycetaceae bacterium]